MSSFKKFDIAKEFDSFDFIRTGIKGLDQLFGGGLPVNNLLFIEEDEFNIYTSLLVKCFASNAVYDNIKLTYFSSNGYVDSASFIKRLPTKRKLDAKTRDGSRDMQIAFRYNHMPSLDDDLGHVMDFGRLLDDNSINGEKLDRISTNFLEDILPVCEKLKSSPSNSPHLIIIDHISSTNFSSANICQFIYQLKSFSRQLAKSSFVITIQHGWLSSIITKRLRNISDSAIQLEAFDPLQPSVYSDDYKGALHVNKISRVISVKDSLITDLGFQLKRNNRYFMVEKLHLPPDIGDTPSRVSTSVTTVSEEIF